MDTQEKRKRIPYGMTNFEEIRLEGCYFVDKTPYIERIEQANKYFFFIRPRRFGKTSLISMLQSYYDIESKNRFEELFGNLYIGSHPTRERNAYLVICLDFSQVSGQLQEYRKAMDDHCALRFHSFCQRYQKYFATGFTEKVQRMEGAVTQLGAIVEECARVGKKIFLFIDEYDHFTNDILSSEGLLDTYESETHREGYLRQFFNAVKGGTNTSISRCFITGVSPVTMDDVTSGFNIGSNYSSANEFNGMVGFTESEVRAMLDYYATTCPFHHTTDELIAWMRPWYDNYCFAPRLFGKEMMFNSNMVLYFIDKYIQNGGEMPENMLDVNIRTDYSKLRMLIRRDKEFTNDASVIQTIVEQGYITGKIAESFPARAITQPQNFISLLYYFGMLTFGGIERGIYKLVIPNEVVREQLYKYLLEMYNENHLVQEDYKRNDLASRLAFEGEWKPYFSYIAECMGRYSSTRDIQKGEAFVHGFTLAMTTLNDFYRPLSESDANKGYADIFLCPLLEIYRDIAHSYIVEFKYVKLNEGESMIEQRRKEAIEQSKRYAQSDIVRSQLGATRLHSLVIVFYGMEMRVCEEVVE
jgi:hypothetical protein